MIVQTEQELLDEGVRKKIIDQIGQTENKNRKNDAFKRYQVYKDNVKIYVVEKMLHLFDLDTVHEMSYSISNISICKKIIDKLARVYSNGVERSVMNEAGDEDVDLTQQIQDLAEILKIDASMKKLNRLFKLERNMMQYIKPYKMIEEDSGLEKFSIQVQSLPPFLYDVVEDPNDREKPMAVILSHFTPEKISNQTAPLTNDFIKTHQANTLSPFGNNRDEKIADTPEDQGAGLNEYIWWTRNHHFTTNEKGEVITQALDQGTTDSVNPIGRLPFLNYALDQDGAFWAEGGSDLIDGSILINSMITHINHIGVTQGYGQFYATGKGIPNTLKIGPNKGIRIEVEKEDPQPQLGFLSANPPLTELRQLVDQHVALILTTNNLSTSGLATQMGQTTNPAAGISMIIDKAESLEDVKDQEQIFKDQEPEMWEIIAKWMNIYKASGQLCDELSEIEIPDDIDVKIKFNDAKPIMSEQDKLSTIKSRKELGLNLGHELLQKDDPDLTDDEAKAKYTEISKQRQDAVANAAKQNVNEDDSVVQSNGSIGDGN